MLSIHNRTRVIEDCQPGSIPDNVLNSPVPLVLKGLVRHWKLVDLGRQSSEAAVDYLKSHYNGKPSQVYFGEPGLNGRYFYDKEVTRLNYETRKAQIDEVLDLILAARQEQHPPSYYIASNLIHTHFPALREENDLHLPRPDPGYPVEANRVSIWIGNKTLACAHYDASSNLACCVVGNRRFSLFPPEQIANLYPGPLEPTPGGQAISMVDFSNPDLDRFPDFPKAVEAGQIAELEPGDALFLPSMWWHQVEGLNDFNILINYWWSEAPAYTGSGMNVLYHALLCLRDKPEHEKRAWREVLDYYVFGDADRAGRHLPEQARGFLGELDDIKARQLRAMLLSRLNR
ncbi:cupin-like domain-containing protein [Bowmanella dokdonensis]|uniref:Cupin-like domain-containing protein n=1 Tax=Bowmanella dokdonensis TaxID=751969 RepID=A0A939DPN2_9ALTE|nr:cupin-like domain-containing protein [Bowmanella dokdonensis]MBN7825641.1 cupin-like domain-containing protein [Bowmanella dokdonensis]